jgi:peptidyl-prolyl cis-trans isomerase SurA
VNNRIRISGFPGALLVACVIGMGAGAGALHAQRVLVDRIVAVVGTEVILESELNEHLYLTAQRMGMSPTDTTKLLELKSDILEGLVTEKVVLQRAKEKGISVTSDEVDAALEKDLDAVRKRFGSEQEFEKTLLEEGLTFESYRQSLREEREKQLIQEKFMQELKLPPKHVTEEEVTQYFEENRDKFGLKPATVKLAHILISPAPADSVVREKEALVDEILLKLSEGAAFEDLAREYSDDDRTKDRGGDVGFLERGDLLPQVERVAFLLNPGEVSGAIKTELGFFIVKLEEARLGKVHLKHILIEMRAGEEDVARARERAYELRERIEGGEDFGELAAVNSSDEETRRHGGELGEFAVEDIPDEYVSVVEALDAGEVSEPFETGEGWEIMKVLEKNAPRPYELDDIATNIRDTLAQEKAFKEFIEKMKEKTFVEIRLEE